MDIDGLKALIGSDVGIRKMDYTWRDVALYALGVGARADELEYTYEKNMKTLPTFLTSVYWNGQFNMTPQRNAPYCPYSEAIAFSAKDLGKWPGGTHMSQELILYRPMDPIKGSVLCKDRILDIYDRGEGKGVVVKTEVEMYDEAGRMLCVNRGEHLLSAYGGFGGAKQPKPDVEIPEDRAPDVEYDDYVTPTQNLLYRLTSDTLPAHVDLEYAKSRGWKAPIMQGLCSFGYAARWAIRTLIPGEPERMTRIYAQMRSFCYVDTKLKFQGWKTEHGMLFRLLDAETGNKILDRGIFEYK